MSVAQLFYYRNGIMIKMFEKQLSRNVIICRADKMPANLVALSIKGFMYSK